MALSPRQHRYVLAACAVLLVGAAIVVAVAVIPQVRVATSADISPEKAVPAFWASAGLRILAALVLMFIATLSRARSAGSTSGLVVTGVVVLFLGFVLGDAALAFYEAGMGTVSTLLLICVASDALAGAVIVATALLRPKATRKGPTGASTS